MTQLQRLVRAAGIQQADLAVRLAIAESTLSCKLAGKRGWDPTEVVVLHDALKSARWGDRSIERPGLRALCLLCGSRQTALI